MDISEPTYQRELSTVPRQNLSPPSPPARSRTPSPISSTRSSFDRPPSRQAPRPPISSRVIPPSQIQRDESRISPRFELPVAKPVPSVVRPSDIRTPVSRSSPLRSPPATRSPVRPTLDIRPPISRPSVSPLTQRPRERIAPPLEIRPPSPKTPSFSSRPTSTRPLIPRPLSPSSPSYIGLRSPSPGAFPASRMPVLMIPEEETPLVDVEEEKTSGFCSALIILFAFYMLGLPFLLFVNRASWSSRFIATLIYTVAYLFWAFIIYNLCKQGKEPASILTVLILTLFPSFILFIILWMYLLNGPVSENFRPQTTPLSPLSPSTPQSTIPLSPLIPPNSNQQIVPQSTLFPSFTNNQFSNNQSPNNQFPNNRFPNNQFSNNQFPNNQFSNNQFPNNQFPQSSISVTPIGQIPANNQRNVNSFPTPIVSQNNFR